MTNTEQITVGTKFKTGRRTAIVREVTPNGYRYSLLKANGQPSNPVYFMGGIDPASIVRYHAHGHPQGQRS